MTGQPWQPQPAADLFAIPVHLDPDVPAGAAVFDLDPEDPRQVAGIRVADREFELTAEQEAQVRDHYRAMDERATEVLAWWDRTARQLGLDLACATPPANIIRITGI